MEEENRAQILENLHIPSQTYAKKVAGSPRTRIDFPMEQAQAKPEVYMYLYLVAMDDPDIRLGATSYGGFRYSDGGVNLICMYFLVSQVSVLGKGGQSL